MEHFSWSDDTRVAKPRCMCIVYAVSSLFPLILVHWRVAALHMLSTHGILTSLTMDCIIIHNLFKSGMLVHNTTHMLK